MNSGRASREHYKNKINDIRYVLAVDEAICLAIYALAFDTDKTSRLAHLGKALRSLKNVTPALEAGKDTEDKHDYDANLVIVYGEAHIHESIQGYVAYDDVLLDGKTNSRADKLRTKNIRGFRENTISRKGTGASGIPVRR